MGIEADDVCLTSEYTPLCHTCPGCIMTKISMTFLAASFLMIQSLSGQTVRLVKDISPGPGSTFASSFVPEDDGIVMAIGQNILFVVKGSNGQYALWTSNGEEVGTYIIHQLGNNASFRDFIPGDDGHVYYSISSNTEKHLYALSTTTLDTLRIHTNTVGINFLTFLNGKLYFESDNALVKVDPATKMSELVYQFGSFRGLRDIGILGDDLILIGGESNGTELYRSDGTTSGTNAYYQLNNGSEFSGDYYMTEAEGKLFFFYNKPSEPYVLHVTDGTTSGTEPLMDLERITFTDLEQTRSIFTWNGKLFFRGRAPGNGGNQDELYVSDGTVAGTFKININDEWSKPAFFTPYNGELYFKADDLGFIFNVYKTNGTQNGTVRAIDAFNLGSGLTFGGDFMVEHQDSLYFYGYRSAVGEELWVSGGTTNTTRSIDIVPGQDDAVPTQMTSTDKYLFLICRTPEHGKELFVVESGSVNTEDQLSGEKWNLYPNPFSGFMKLDGWDATEDLTLEIFDLNGLRVARPMVKDGQVSLPELPTGAYVVIIRQGETVLSRRMMKI